MPEHRAFWLAREGNQPDEYEDAFAADPGARRFAVADGAAESAFARLWARLLVDDFVQHGPVDLERWTDRLPALQTQWQQAIGERPLPWYIQPKFRQGAFATFLGLALGTPADGAIGWQAVAVGDTCLFHTRGAEVLTAFPLSRSQDFDNYPNLVGSRAAPQYVRDKLSLRAPGSALPDDRLWLMTDALAQWCLAQHEAGRDPWAEISSVCLCSEPDTRFAAWIDGLRQLRSIRNDDVTLLILII